MRSTRGIRKVDVSDFVISVTICFLCHSPSLHDETDGSDRVQERHDAARDRELRDQSVTQRELVIEYDHDHDVPQHIELLEQVHRRIVQHDWILDLEVQLESGLRIECAPQPTFGIS